MRYVDTRHKTRDLLLEYDQSIMPLHPRAGGLAMVYPWETQNLAIVSDLLYNLAHNSGYNGTREEFYSNFGSYLTNNNQKIIFKTYPEFPQIGQQDMLYFDLNEKILYYWDNEYIPVNAMLIANTIVNGGEA